MSFSSKRNRTGVLAVEVAICLPLLLMVLFVCYEMSRANMILHATESAAYEGARVGIVPGATPEQVRAAAEGILRSVGISEFTIEVSPSVIKNDTPLIEVTVRVPFEKNTSIPARFVNNANFKGVCKLTREIP